LDNIATAIGRNPSFVSRAERGQVGMDVGILFAIKKSMNIENAPLFDYEIETFKGRLYYWRELIRNRRMDEAKNVQDELIVILDMPFEQNLISLYRMIEARFLMTNHNFEAAGKILALYEAQLAEMDAESRFLYYHNWGSLGFYEKDFKKSLGFYLQSFDILNENPSLSKDSGLLFNIAACYSKLCLPLKAIRFAELACEVHTDEPTNILGSQIDNLLGGNYSSIGETKIARHFFEKSLKKARNINSELSIGMALHNLGLANEREGKITEAKEFYHEVLPYYQKHKDLLLGAHYRIIRCLIKENDFRQAKDMLEEIASQHTYNENQLILFKSLAHIMTLKDNASSNYIEKTTIPHLLNANDYFRALDYCELLEAHYKKKGAIKKLLAVTEILRDIYKHIIFGKGCD